MTYYSITPLKQPNTMACWITTLTLLRRWSSQDDTLSIHQVIDTLGSPFDIYYDTNSGLPGSDTKNFCDIAGIEFDNPQNYSVAQWENDLKEKGPLLVDVLVYIDPKTKTAFTHSRILVGIDIDTNNEVNSSFIFIDPARGQEVSETFESFLEDYEAEPANQIDHIQVCYSNLKP